MCIEPYHDSENSTVPRVRRGDGRSKESALADFSASEALLNNGLVVAAVARSRRNYVGRSGTTMTSRKVLFATPGTDSSVEDPARISDVLRSGYCRAIAKTLTLIGK